MVNDILMHFTGHFLGSMVHSQMTSGFIGANTGSQPVGLPVVTTKTGLQAQNLQSLNILPQTDASPRSGNLQDIQGFTKEEHLQDDFGDFQQSAAPQLYGNINKPLSQGSLSTSGTSAVFAINQDTGMVPGSGAVGSGTITTSDSSKMNQEENISQGLQVRMLS